MWKSEPTYEISLYLGSRRGYDGPSFMKQDVIDVIQTFQSKWTGNYCTLRITETTFVSGEYQEDGWGIHAIHFPHYPVGIMNAVRFMKQLAKHLLSEFDQNRISVVTPVHTFMFENKNA